METKYIVNNATGQTITGNITINGGLTITGDTSIRPYKVYTALLTQGGGDNPLELVDGDAVTKGVTYLIDAAGGDSDFSNVGGPKYEGTSISGTYFVATTDGIPNNYGGAALIYNTGAPVVTVLENTIGNIWFTYDGIGGYTVNSNGLFLDNKTFVVIGDSFDGGQNGAIIASYYQGSNNILISSAIIDFNSSAIVGFDELLYKTPIEIRVYN